MNTSTSTAYTFLSLPPLLHQDFSHHTFHQTPLLHHPPPPPSPPPPLHDFDLGLMSCTESLGCESSDEVSSLYFRTNFRSSCSDGEDDYSSASSSSHSPCSPCSSSSSSSYMSSSSSPRSRSRSTKRWSEKKKEFPPPLTTMNENGRRNFVLRSERNNGRLEIVKVVIERPEFLYALRQNGRLTLHFARCLPEFEDDDEFLGEEEEEEAENDEEEEVEEETEEEREKITEVERERKIPASVRRCRPGPQTYVWGQQQRSFVTTV